MLGLTHGIQEKRDYTGLLLFFSSNDTLWKSNILESLLWASSDLVKSEDVSKSDLYNDFLPMPASAHMFSSTENLMQNGALDHQQKKSEEKKGPLWTTSSSIACSIMIFFLGIVCMVFLALPEELVVL